MASRTFQQGLERLSAAWQAVRAFAVALVTVNPTLKIFSLLLATLMWGFVAAQQGGETSEVQFTTPLVLKNIPDGLQVTSAPVQSVSVLMRATRTMANTLNPNAFQVAIDLGNQLPGSIEFSLNERNISYRNTRVPPDITVQQISPARVPVTLEETISRTLPIEPRFVGDPAEGFILKSIQVVPSDVPIVGPRSAVESMEHIPTRPLDVESLNADVELLVTLDLPERVRVAMEEEPFIQARIEVSNTPSRLLLRGIEVRFRNAALVHRVSTRSINVYLEGPESAISQLTKENVYAVVDLAEYPPGDYRGITPEVVVPDTVKVVEQWPILDLFVIDRNLNAEENASPPSE